MSGPVCFTVGRTSPSDGLVIADERVGDYRVTTYSFVYSETVVCMPRERAAEIARRLGKKIDELDDEDVARYLVEVERMEEKVSQYGHSFARDW